MNYATSVLGIEGSWPNISIHKKLSCNIQEMWHSFVSQRHKAVRWHTGLIRVSAAPGAPDPRPARARPARYPQIPQSARSRPVRADAATVSKVNMLLKYKLLFVYSDYVGYLLKRSKWGRPTPTLPTSAALNWVADFIHFNIRTKC